MIEVVVGRIGRPHGVRGEATVEVRTDEPERRFVLGRRLRSESDGRVFTISSIRWHQGRLLLGFDELADRNAVEAARGTLLVTDVDESEAASDPEEFYDRDLVGLEVRDHTGARVGEVSGVLHPGVQDLLQVRTEHGPRLIPFVAALVPVLDPAAGYLQVADVGGLVGPEAGED